MFFIYLYQRWCYRVDMTRGIHGDDGDEQPDQPEIEGSAAVASTANGTDEAPAADTTTDAGETAVDATTVKGESKKTK